MTSAEVENYLNKNDSDYKFENVSPENKLSNRRDLCAFLIINKLVSGDSDIVAAAEHDTIYLTLEPEEIPDEQTLHDLYRCGVCFDDALDSFYIFR